MDVHDIARQLDSLMSRVQALEDELAIQRLIVTYGFRVDIGDADGTAALFAEDAVYDIDVMHMNGRDAVHEMVRSERHQALLPNCAHTMGPLTVAVDGDKGTAVGYSRLYLRNGDNIDLWRLSFNRWELVRRNNRWLIFRRATRVLGHEEAATLFREPLP